MYGAIAAMDSIESKALSAVFIIGWIILSRIILYDLFIIIIMKYFKVTETIEMIKLPGRMEDVKHRMRTSMMNAFVLMSRHQLKVQDVSFNDNNGNGTSARHVSISSVSPLYSKATRNISSASCLDFDDDPRLSRLRDLVQKIMFTFRPVSLHCSALLSEGRKSRLNSRASESWDLSGRGNTLMPALIINAGKDRTLLLFRRDNFVRLICIRLQKSVSLNSMIYICIFSSCFLLFTVPPAPDIPGMTSLFSPGFTNTCDTIFTSIFTTEMCINILAQVFIRNYISFFLYLQPYCCLFV